MTSSNRPVEMGGHPVTRAGRWLVMAWGTGLLVVFGLMGALAVRAEYHNRTDATRRHLQRVDPNLREEGVTEADVDLPPGAQPVKVACGIYVDRVSELSVKEMAWDVDFYLWFNWQGDLGDPGESVQVVDGTIESREKQEEFTDGDRHYVRYRMEAKITKFFDVSRFPCDDHLLTINIEHPPTQRQEMLFVADTDNSNISSRVKLPGYRIHQVAAVEKPHSYKTTRGDPRLPAGTKATYSQFRLGIWIARSGGGLYMKMFVSLFVAAGIAVLAFCVKPTHVDPRFGLGVGALFAAVANSYVTSSLIPDTGAMTLADVVNGMGTVMILATLAESTVSLYLFDSRGEEALSRLFDKVSFLILMPLYVALNAALPWAASL